MIRVWLNGIRLALATRLSDRVDFAASLLVMMGIELVPSLLVVALYGGGHRFPGWSLHEALLIQGIALLARGIVFPLFGGVAWSTAERVREGTFELHLLQPRPTLLLAAASAFDAEDIGKFIGGLGLTAWCLAQVGPVAPQAWLGFLLLFAVALLVYAGFVLLVSALLIVWVGNWRIYEVFDCLVGFGQYPGVLLPKRAQVLLGAPLPIAAIALLPAEMLLARPLPLLWPTLAAAVLFLPATLYLWNRLLRGMTGAGG